LKELELIFKKLPWQRPKGLQGTLVTLKMSDIFDTPIQPGSLTSILLQTFIDKQKFNLSLLELKEVVELNCRGDDPRLEQIKNKYIKLNDEWSFLNHISSHKSINKNIEYLLQVINSYNNNFSINFF
jgi:hypothetical protein